MTFRLQQATSGDAPAIASILSNWIDETDWMPRIHTRAEDQGFGQFLIDRTQVTVAKQAETIVGFMAVQGDTVHSLYLAPQARGQGVGAALIRAAKSGRDSLTLWTFQANTRARAFYDREGFAEVERTNGQGNDENLPDIRLIWVRDTQND